MKKTPKVCYTTLVNKLEAMDSEIMILKEQIKQLKSCFVTEDEVCQDEIDADRAAYEAVGEICLDALLDVEPKGDA